MLSALISANLARCDAWCNPWTLDADECTSCGDSSSERDGSATSPAHDQNHWPPFSSSQCIGGMHVSGASPGASPSFDVVRNTGGGTSACCSYHPRAAPARVRQTTHGDSLQLKLEPRIEGYPSRNGARTYLADMCQEGSYAQTRYASLRLLGKTIAVTIDLSAAKCGCNVVRNGTAASRLRFLLACTALNAVSHSLITPTATNVCSPLCVLPPRLCMPARKGVVPRQHGAESRARPVRWRSLLRR